MKYQVVIAMNPREFEEMVTKQLAVGWRCQGGVAIYVTINEHTKMTVETWAQAMILVV